VEQPEFRRREGDLLAVHEDTMGHLVDQDRSRAEPAAGSERRCPEAPEDGAHPHDELRWGERFEDVIVGAQRFVAVRAQQRNDAADHGRHSVDLWSVGIGHQPDAHGRTMRAGDKAPVTTM